MSMEKTILKLKEGLAKFKEDSTKNGWEDDEVDEKVAEIFENFPWYKFNAEEKTWKSRLWSFCLFSLIIYLAAGAYLERNKRMRKNINDYLFDLQIQYHKARISRFLSLPFIQFYDLQSRFDAFPCLMKNPFFEKEPIKCDFCENITSISLLEINDEGINEMIANGELFTLHDVPGYSNSTIGFKDVRDLFMKNGEDMDKSICEIYQSKQYKKVSDYFKLSEEDLHEKKISIGWKNCEGYGTRFYRKLFTRPEFVSNASEILLEKYMFFLQPGLDSPFEAMGESDGVSYIFQVQGESMFSFFLPAECHDSCIDKPINVTLNAGQMVVYPNSGWKASTRSHGERLAIIYVSAFIP